MSGIFWILVVVGASLALSFFLSGMEAGVFALSRLRIRQRMREGDPRARLLHSFLENPEDFLWTILVGNTLATCLAVGVSFWALHRWLVSTGWELGLAVAATIFLFYAVGDLLAKMLFRQLPNRLCLLCARPFRLLHLALSPAVVLVAWLAGGLLRLTGGRRFTGRLFGNREELRRLMQESAGNLTKDERVLANRVLDLQTLTVGAVATPMDKANTVTAQTPVVEVFRMCRQTGVTRLPVREAAGGRVAGILTLRNSLYRPDLDTSLPAGAFLQPALYVEASLRLEVALQRLRKAGQRMAIVLDRDRQEVGVLSLDDILRGVFGEVDLE
ncbi:MAG TPA: CNNM domain-containing protein [Verrucomicrobiota bacterium]|nr:CNNM domain-containing protein [Verrucomicrobiota bacterium]HNU50093.1 CNNM domain-containing protein [Verrucomicrobiota bacterium]